jgi:hypothetical protein
MLGRGQNCVNAREGKELHAGDRRNNTVVRFIVQQASSAEGRNVWMPKKENSCACRIQMMRITAACRE